MVKIIGSDPERWVNLDSVVQADASDSTGKLVLTLVVSGGMSTEVTDPAQIQRLAVILGLEDLPQQP
jgi:hypothetical protein